MHIVFYFSEDCKEDEFKCSSGTCIPERFLCDDITNDCENNEDENVEICGKKLIQVSNVHSYTCFIIWLITLGCSEGGFQCSSGDCIPESYKCDGITDDCSDNEDESKEQCGVAGEMIQCY